MFGLFKKRKAGPTLDRSQIVPRIKNTQFTAALRDAGVPEDQMPITEPLTADLLVTYAFDLPDTFVMATPNHLAELGIDPASLRDLAIENVKRQIPGISLQQSGSVFRAATGNNLDACTLLSRNIWTEHAQRMKGKLVAAVPNRDIILFCDSEAEDGMLAMREITKQAFDAGGTHALTLTFLEWSHNGWIPYDA
jgi:uncharacterized protein YtpQ (UPF0354 family)